VSIHACLLKVKMASEKQNIDETDENDSECDGGEITG
jgi:hypothetical protein